MITSRLITTSVAALTVVGAGLVYAQSTTSPGPGSTPGTTTEPATQAQPATPSTGTATMPSQETTQRSTVPMAPDAQADRN